MDCVSLNLDDVIVEDRLVFNVGYQSSQMLRIANPKDFKNVTFDALSSFFVLMQLDERMLSSCKVTGLVKNVLSLCGRSVPFSTNISCSRQLPLPLYVQSNSDLFFSKIEQSFWSMMHIVKSVMLRVMIGK